jgi:hypothetical protein
MPSGHVMTLTHTIVVITEQYPDPSLTACYWIPETKRLLRMLFQRRRIRDPYFCPDPRASLWTYLSFPLRPSSRWFVFELSDPKPFLSDMLSVLGKLARRK